MSRNNYHTPARNRALSAASATPTHSQGKKRTYSTESSASSNIAGSAFRPSHGSPRKRLSVHSEFDMSTIFCPATGTTSPAETPNGQEEDDEEDYSGVNAFTIEDLTGENDEVDGFLDGFLMNEPFGDYNESLFAIFDDFPTSTDYPPATHGRNESYSSEKKVRFEGVSMSASSSPSSSDDDIDFPDNFFMEPEKLPMPFNNTWDKSPSPSVAASEDGSYWDVQDTGAGGASDYSIYDSAANYPDDSEDSDSDESNDEDIDDETDEEEWERPPPSKTRSGPPLRISRAPSPTTPLPPKGRRPVPVAMTLDDDKEYTTTVNGKVVLFKSPQEQRYFRALQRNSMSQMQADFISQNYIFMGMGFEFPTVPDVLTSSGDLNAMFGSNLANIMATPTANTSASDCSPSTSTMDYESTLESEDGSDGEEYRFEDFLALDEEDGQEDEFEGFPDDELTSPTSTIQRDFTPAKPVETPARQKAAGILEHLDKSKVGVFRNHQDNHRRISSLGADPTLRASASTPVRPGKSVDLLTTPMRRRANSNVYRRFGRTVESGHLRQKRSSFSRHH